MISYLITYNFSDGNGFGFGNVQIDRDQPIRSVDDVRHFEKLLRKQVPGIVVVLSFTRFESEATGGRN
ncbi:hypothetical protein [Paractinoplanes lichenicola]|uniref:Uncharacterized protein n=1 Tax=Paractinoplanes lichenicola TaxID=2802976 RepID=A0ABS1VXI3_9ACTN|nr:hypothetical protein [Actinoplanes lichenicola]MBL7259165.1 hypothetical protein [Actinoplanes lichenicola]